MNETILLLGGGGYLGAIATEVFLKEGFTVRVVDDFRYGEMSLAHLTHNKNLSIVNADVRDFPKYKNWLSSSDIIIPLAALVGAPLCAARHHEAVSINLTFPETLFKKLSRQQLILMPTTNSAYGSTGGTAYCTENSPLRPISKYAIDKVAVESKLLNECSAISLRLATVFGMSPRMRLDLLVNNFVWRAVSDGVISLFEGHFIRNYIHVRDVARAFIHAINRRESMVNDVFNVGLSTANISKFDLAKKIQIQLPSTKIIQIDNENDPDQRNYLVSNDKIESTGFAPQFHLDDGIEELIKGLQILAKYRYGNV